MPLPHALRCSPRSGHRPSPGYPIRARPSPRPWRARGCRTGTARRRRRSGSRTLHEFDERSPEGGGVGEPDATAPRPGASMFVDDPTASFPDAREGRVHARDMEGEVVDARPTAFEELGHRGAGVGRLEQLDMRLPDRDEGCPDPIGGDVLWRTLRRTDERSPLLDGGREVRHRDADMVELQFDPSGQNARDGVCSPNRRRQTSATSPSDAPATTLASTYGRTFSSAPVAASRRSSAALVFPASRSDRHFRTAATCLRSWAGVIRWTETPPPPSSGKSVNAGFPSVCSFTPTTTSSFDSRARATRYASRAISEDRKPRSIAGSEPPIASIRSRYSRASFSIRSVRYSISYAPPSGSTVLGTPDSSARICCVRSARRADDSVGSPNASSNAFVCSDWVPPSTAAIASSVVRTTFSSGCWAVRLEPAVCVWNLICFDRAWRAPNVSWTIVAHSRRAARNFAISSRKFRSDEKKNESRGRNSSRSRPRFWTARTYAIALARVKATSWAAVAPASRMW